MSRDIGAVIMALCEAIDTPRSLAVSILFRSGEHRQLVDLGFDPLHYRHDVLVDSSAKFRNDYLATEFLSKAKFLNTGYDVRARSILDFHAYEAKCRATNERFRQCSAGGFPPAIGEVLCLASRKIAGLVGPQFDVRVLFDHGSFGPGATTLLSRAEAYTDNKVLDLSVTPRALKYVNLDLGTSKVWNDICRDARVSEIRYVRGNKVTTVSKNSKTDRTIAIEPCVNLFYQKGIGAWLKGLLLKVNVDLFDQSRNQSFARMAYSKGYATVDLKGASASISRELVWNLVPYELASVMDDLRSPLYELDGATGIYEQFSSMGNGFTFELESLIFWAISQAVIDTVRPPERGLAVFGDDIVIHQDCLPLLKTVFEFCGFELNSKKTHYLGGFRESCGKHYFFGMDVSPIYQKERIDVLEEAYRLANRIRRLARDRCAGAGSEGVLRPAWLAAVEAVRRLEEDRGVYFEVPISSELDTGLALPLQEMKGYAWLRFKHGDRLVRKKIPHRYDRNSMSTRYYIWSERRKRKYRKASTYAAWLRNDKYRPEIPFENSRLKGTFGPSTVTLYEPAVRDEGWLE